MHVWLLVTFIVMQGQTLGNFCPQTPNEVAERINGDPAYWEVLFPTVNDNGELVTITFLYRGPTATLTAEKGTLLQQMTRVGDQTFSSGPIPADENIEAEEASYFCSNMLPTPTADDRRDTRMLIPGDVASWCLPNEVCPDGAAITQGATMREVMYEGPAVDIWVPSGIAFFVVENGTRRTHQGQGAIIVHQVIQARFVLLPRA